MIKLELDINSVNFILQTLGELPTKTGAWDLLKNIKELKIEIDTLKQQLGK